MMPSRFRIVVGFLAYYFHAWFLHHLFMLTGWRWVERWIFAMLPDVGVWAYLEDAKRAFGPDAEPPPPAP